MPLPKDPVDELDLPTGEDDAAGAGGSPDPTPDPLDGKSVEELRALLKGEQERGQTLAQKQAELEKMLKAEREQSSHLAYAALLAAGRGDPGAAPPAQLTTPDPDEDPRGYAEFVAERKAEEIFNKRFASKAALVDRTHALALSTAAATNLATARSFLPGFVQIEQEVEAFMAQFPFEHRANPGAYEEAYYRVLGHKHAENLRERAAKDAAPASAHARPSAGHDPDTDRPAAIPPLARKVAVLEGMKPKEWAAFSGKGMDIDDFMRLKAAQGGK